MLIFLQSRDPFAYRVGILLPYVFFFFHCGQWSIPKSNKSESTLDYKEIYGN